MIHGVRSPESFDPAVDPWGAQELVDASEESYEANFHSHRHGLATITDLIGAERDLMAARYTLIQSKADLLVSSAALLHATGTALLPNARTH